MRIVTEFPRQVRHVENLWIPLADGTRLAARMWLPEDAEDAPVPAILEYIPYRKRDYMRARDEAMHPWFAGHGYATVRVDMRGSGESDGIMLDEYTKQEHDDALEVIAWLAAQPWCTGKVGMMGKSWGGFNALQVAARRPPALGAIVTVMSTDDRYADDIHYLGGSLLNDNLMWGTVMLIFSARPPDPEIVGERWRAMWLERLEAETFLPDPWLRHQRRDGYWQHGSVCEDFAAIRCPVYAVGGWADGYSNAVFRLLAGLTVPRKGLIGPWAHLYPQDGVPGPAIGFLQDCRRWWDHWLKGEANGVMDEPMLTVWQQDPSPPAAYLAEVPGRWVGERCWPSPRTHWRRLRLNADGLGDAAGLESVIAHRSPQTVGLAGGDFASFGIPGDLPLDQREDDGGSLVFDAPPLDADLAILGAPAANLVLAADRTTGFVAVRLEDVAPSGWIARVSYGILNLTHRERHGAVRPIVPGERMTVRVQLNDIAHVFARGHRMRVALSTAYWPLVWPSPESTSLTVFTGASSLELPVRPAADLDKLIGFAEPESAPPMKALGLRPGRYERTVTRDIATGEVVHRTFSDGGLFRGAGEVLIEDIDLALGHVIDRRLIIRPDDPLSARQEIAHDYVMRRGPWSVRLKARSRMWSTRETFHMAAELDAYEGETRVFSREWGSAIPRDGV
ncbi:MAG: CocE/NonD family hydrolase [Alphaproteobacteria bacterium]